MGSLYIYIRRAEVTAEMGKHRRHKHRSHGRGNYYYIAGPGTGIFNPSVFAFQVRNLPRLPGMTPIVTNKDGTKQFEVQKYTTLHRL